MSEGVPAPPEAFNFARHLLEANAERADKVAFVDDVGALTYGALDERARRFAAALRDAGVKREERVMLLMLDSADWPVAFLGAMLRRRRAGRGQYPAHRRRRTPTCSNIPARRP